MINSRSLRAIGLALLVTAISVSGPLPFSIASQENRSQAAMRVTPPAPVIEDAERVAELAARRKKVAERIGPNSVLILFSTEPRVYTNDVDYAYRQENNLFYLTMLKQENATLVLMPGNTATPEILFIPKRNPAQETWTGRMYSPEEAKAISGIGEIWEASEFEKFVEGLRNRRIYRPADSSKILQGTPGQQGGADVLTGAMGRSEANLYILQTRQPDSREYKKEQKFALDWYRTANSMAIRNATPIFNEMRMRKSPLELKLLQYAIDISIEAHMRAMATAGRLKYEYEVAAEIEYTFRRRNADYWGYPSIVGCGPNATTLHYITNNAPLKPNSLLLMDVGAEYEHYTADVTRTFPINGKFSKEQAEIYQIVYDAQEAAARATKPGNTLSDVHNAAAEVIKEGLLRLGLITDKSTQQFRMWFMHGNSHWLGMNVHDVSIPGARFEPGMTFTNEPGIYIREDALDYLPKTPENEKLLAAIMPAFQRYKGIGVRIEDDLLVTAEGCEWMTKSLPRSIQDIEAFIANASKEVGISSLSGGARGFAASAVAPRAPGPRRRLAA